MSRLALLAGLGSGSAALACCCAGPFGSGRIAPGAAEAHNDLAQSLALLGRHDDALAQFREAKRLRDRWPVPISGAALILATHPLVTSRNTGEAITLARRAAELTGRRDQGALEILAIAYAAAGKFTDAVAAQKESVALAPDKSQPQSVLAGYESHLR